MKVDYAIFCCSNFVIILIANEVLSFAFCSLLAGISYSVQNIVAASSIDLDLFTLSITFS